MRPFVEPVVRSALVSKVLESSRAMLFSSPPSSESVAPQIRFLDFALFFVNTALDPGSCSHLVFGLL